MYSKSFAQIKQKLNDFNFDHKKFFTDKKFLIIIQV